MFRQLNKHNIAASVRMMVLSLMMLIPASSAIAQQRHHFDQRPQMGQNSGPAFNPQEFRQKFESYVTKRAALSPAEARAFFPLFHKMKTKEREIRDKIKRMLYRVQTERVSNTDCQRILQEVLRLRQQKSDLEQRSYRDFSRVLSAEKLLRVMEAERAFGREMFRKGPEQNGHYNNGSNRR